MWLAHAAEDIKWNGKLCISLASSLIVLLLRYINNQTELFSFTFDGVLPQDCKQDEVMQHSPIFMLRHSEYS